MNVVKNDKKEFLDVYISPVCETLPEREISHAERAEEIRAVSNDRVRREKYSAWLLLERALGESLGISTESARLTKDENGKWSSPYFELSISHSGSVVAVAISHAPVGIDIEPLYKSLSEAFAKKNLTTGELDEYLSLGDSQKNAFLLTRWCTKEAVFKKSGASKFSPSRICADDNEIFIKHFSHGGEEYVCAVSGNVKATPPTFTLV